jgi:hypothetical protein
MSTAAQAGNVLLRSSETDDLDFKAEFHNKLGDWLEIIKDIVAFANSGGGTILIGVNDDGSPSGADISAICETDPADVTNKIYSYTGIQFHAFELDKAEKQGKEVCVISVRSSRVPIVFTKIGNYESSPGKPRTAFGIGVVYFRHGAKSEPGNTEDLRKFVEREVEFIRHSWLSGIAKVVDAPAGSRVMVFAPENAEMTEAEIAKFQLTDDPAAPQILALRLDQTYPYRQKEVVTSVNTKLAGKKKVNPHDAQCINSVYKVKENVKFCHTQKHASPQYSEQFVDWIVARYEEDQQFFEKTREQADKLRGKK